MFYSAMERAIVRNLRRKEVDAGAMNRSLSAETHDAVMAEVFGQSRRTNTYCAGKRITAPSWLQTENA